MDSTISAPTRAQTKKEIASFLSVTTRTIDNLMSRGILPYVKIGRLVRFDLDEVKRVLAQRCGRNNRQ